MCRSLPHRPAAFISRSTSPGPGVGGSSSTTSTRRSPGSKTPSMLKPPSFSIAMHYAAVLLPPPARAANAARSSALPLDVSPDLASSLDGAEGETAHQLPLEQPHHDHSGNENDTRCRGQLSQVQ